MEEPSYVYTSRRVINSTEEIQRVSLLSGKRRQREEGDSEERFYGQRRNVSSRKVLSAEQMPRFPRILKMRTTELNPIPVHGRGQSTGKLEIPVGSSLVVNLLCRIDPRQPEKRKIKQLSDMQQREAFLVALCLCCSNSNYKNEKHFLPAQEATNPSIKAPAPDASLSTVSFHGRRHEARQHQRLLTEEQQSLGYISPNTPFYHGQPRQSPPVQNIPPVIPPSNSAVLGMNFPAPEC